jgi:peptidyl-prolyl cis-trans isomerase C
VRARALTHLLLPLLGLSTSVVFAADTKPVATVGAATVSAAELVRRLARIPDFQRAALADGSEKLKHRVLETQLIPELLYAQEAERLKLAERPSFVAREREIMRQAMERELRAEVERKKPVTSDDVNAYFEANRARFETPRRIRIWRIVTDDETLAKKIIADAQGVDGLKHWSQHAREDSLDKATQFRDGDLGFVHDDGKTDAPTLRVDPVLFANADKLADGELVKEPFKEGLHWAVIWRRGSAPAITRSVAQEEGSIRQVLTRERIEKARQDLLAELKPKYVTTLNERVLETVRFESDGTTLRQSEPRAVHAAPAGSSLPVAGERGLR